MAGQGGNLGGATFTVTADTAQFQHGLQQAQEQAKGFNRSILQAAYALDDLQYGFRAIVNNIPQLAMGLGGPGVAGALGIAAVAASQLTTHWDALFGPGGDKLPRIKEGLEGLADSLKKIHEAMKPLQEAVGQRQEGTRGVFDDLMDQLGFGEGSLKNQQKLDQLRALEREARSKLADEKVLDSMGPETTKVARETAAAFKKAVATLPEGGDTLMGTLMARGMGLDEARRMVAGAGRGNVGHLQDIIANLTPEERRGRFAGIVAAQPAERKAAEEEKKRLEAQEKVQKLIKQADEEHARKLEAQIRDEKEIARQREDVQKKAFIANQEAKERAIEDRREKIQDERQDFQYRQQLRGLNRASIFGSPLEYAMAAQTGDHGEARKILEANRAMDLKLRDIRDELKKERRAKFGP